MRSRSPRRWRSRDSRSRSPVGKKTLDSDRLPRNKNFENTKRNDRSDVRRTERDSPGRDKYRKRSHSFSSDRKRKYERSYNPSSDNRKRSPADRMAKKRRSSEMGKSRREIEEGHKLPVDRNAKSRIGKREGDDSSKSKGNAGGNNSRTRGADFEPEPIFSKRFDQTEFSINDRFSSFSITKPLVIDETISVEIERNIDGTEDFVIPDYFDPQYVTVLRRSDEGKKPFYIREEFCRRDFDEDEKEYSERRVVKVIRTAGNNTMSSRDIPSIFDDLKNVNVNRLLDDSNIRLLKLSGTNTDIHKNRHDVNRDRSGFRNDRRFGTRRSSGMDLRLTLNRGRNDRFSGRKTDIGGTTSSVQTSDIRSYVGNMEGFQHHRNKDSQELPDFSRRPGKYSYDAWRDKPELIPKGPSYFEHDNRDRGDQDTVRGRNFYRGRAGRIGYSQRGAIRGAPRRTENRFGSDFDHWKHDKFEEMEDNKPTSTTEK